MIFFLAKVYKFKVIFFQIMGMAENSQDFDFVVTATRTENDRKMKVPGEVPAVGKMSFEIARLREEIKHKDVIQLKEILERQDRILNNLGKPSKKIFYVIRDEIGQNSF